jgi:protein-disulfide isomerase
MRKFHPWKLRRFKMSKRQEIRQRRQRERTRNRILVIFLVSAGALLIAFAFIRPLILQTQATATANQGPVISITPRAINTTVNGVHLGNPNAPVKLDVYEDFRCSACLNYTQNYEPQIIQTYVETGKVYYTIHSFIVIDGNDGTDASYRSANAAMCAAEQGHFWDYKNTLFANQVTESASLFTDERLVTMAQNLNLDMTAFNQCYQAKRYASDIQNDISQAHSLNLTRTPSILVDGSVLQIQFFTQVATAIDAALAGK